MSKIATPNNGKIIDLTGKAVSVNNVSEDTKQNMIKALEQLVDGLKSGGMTMPDSIIILPFFPEQAQLIYLGEPTPQDMVYAKLSKFVARMAVQ